MPLTLAPAEISTVFCSASSLPAPLSSEYPGIYILGNPAGVQGTLSKSRCVMVGPYGFFCLFVCFMYSKICSYIWVRVRVTLPDITGTQQCVFATYGHTDWFCHPVYHLSSSLQINCHRLMLFLSFILRKC